MARKYIPMTLGLLAGAILTVGTALTVSALREDRGKAPEEKNEGNSGNPAREEGGNLQEPDNKFRVPMQTEEGNSSASFDPDRERERLEKRIAELQGKLSDQAYQRKLETARKLVELLTANESGNGDENGLELMQIMEKSRELDEEVFPFFEDLYRDPGTPEKQRQIVLDQMIRLGGESTARFLREILNDPGVPPETRKKICSRIGFSSKALEPGEKPSIFGMRHIPMEREEILRMTVSAKSDDRVAAAGLLSWDNSPAALGTLQNLMLGDSDKSVRRAAIQSLGYRGDRSTLVQLENLLQNKETKELKWALKSAISQLRKRWPG